jgi:hypothetical protein
MRDHSGLSKVEKSVGKNLEIRRPLLEGPRYAILKTKYGMPFNYQFGMRTFRFRITKS